MLAGLLFATHEADDRPGMLTATLPFGGVTLIEYQARLLIAAGAAQLVIVVARLTPELLGAIARIGHRGVAVDPVRSAIEAQGKLHPLSRVLMLTDGLTTTEEAVAVMARDGGDALLVVAEKDIAPGFERVGGGMAWAGIARLEARRFAELAAMPRDYDIQSTLIMLASQAGAMHVLLPPDAVRQGHAIGHAGAALEARGRTVLAAMVSGRGGWFDRFLVAPAARALIPLLVPRAVPAGALAGGSVAVGVGGLAALWLGWAVTGLVLALAASFGLSLGAILADLRDEQKPARLFGMAAVWLPAAAILLDGRAVTRSTVDGSALVLAIAAVAIAALGERALAGRNRRIAWGGVPAYLLLVLAGGLIRLPLLGLALAAAYATGTAAVAIERLRRQP